MASHTLASENLVPFLEDGGCYSGGFLTEDAANTLVTSYLLSRLDYCNCLLMGTPKSVIQPLQVLLAPHHHHSTPLLEKLHLLPISEHIKYKVACMCFNAMNGSDPAYLPELLNVYTPSRSLRSASDTHMLKIQQYKRKSHGFRAFSGPHIWNSLPQDLRHCSTLSSFKAKLKTSSSHSIFTPTNVTTQFLLQSLCACMCVPARACVFPYNTLCKMFW